MKTVKGNLIDLAEQGEFDVIVQGCNCFCTMGSGIAREIRHRYPNAYTVDLATLEGDYNKLGTFTMSPANLDREQSKFLIVNAYTQYGFNRGQERDDLFEYVSFAMILQKLAFMQAEHVPNGRFGFPKIGCGLAGGDEDRIMQHLQFFSEVIAAEGGTVTVVEFE